MKKNCLARPSKENMSKMHDFGEWCDPGGFGNVLDGFVILECRITVCN